MGFNDWTNKNVSFITQVVMVHVENHNQANFHK